MPPPQPNIPLIHKIGDLYQYIYTLSRQFSKRDKLGIYLRVENTCLEILELVISAAFENKTNKLPILSIARVKTEVLKRLIRVVFNLKVIDDKNYLKIELDLQEISKMINGWIRYAK